MIHFDNGFTLYTHAERKISEDAEQALLKATWPSFVLEDVIAKTLFSRLYSDFSAYQFGVYAPDGQLAAIGNSLFFTCDGTPDALPDEGWDWVLEKGMQDIDAGRTWNMMAALGITVAPAHTGKGLGHLLIGEISKIAAHHNIDVLIVPVRPTWKSHYPLIGMNEYITWTRPDGLPFDPWLRTHCRVGGRIVRVCPQSMCVHGTVADWERWTSLSMPGSGQYVIPGGLVPLTINREHDEGVYVEPNVWVLHQIKQAEA